MSMVLKEMKSLLDEQKAKISNLQSEIERLHRWECFTKDICSWKDNKLQTLRKEVARLNKVIAGKNVSIKEKDEVIENISKELAHSKSREEELTATVEDYLKEIKELRGKLADKVVDEIDAQALKSAENALSEKDDVINELTKGIKSLFKMVDGDPILNMKKKDKDKKKHSSHSCKISTKDVGDNFMEIIGIW